MKPGKHQMSKQRCQDSVMLEVPDDPAQSFVLPLYTMHELRGNQLLCFVQGQGY